MKSIIVIGNGMVGHRFCEEMFERGQLEHYRITVFGGERHPAYDRVHLSSYFSPEPVDLSLTNPEWYESKGIELYLGDPIVSIDRQAKTVTSVQGVVKSYDKLIFATGSSPFIPSLPGIEKQGVFAYRTLDDLELMTAYAKNSKKVAVIGGGLLGLEAAKACVDLGLETSVIEMAPRLMPRQLDAKGSDILVQSIKKLGIKVYTGVVTESIYGDGTVEGINFGDGTHLDYDMVVVSAGIKPNCGVAKAAGLITGERGGIEINRHLETSDPSIMAIGECALFGGMIYGLVAPGYEMASAAARRLSGENAEFTGADMSTKLKLLGLDVASLGNPFDDCIQNKTVEIHDTVAGIYKKLIIDPSGEKLIGAILVGDAEAYGVLSLYVKGKKLPESPQSLIVKGGHSSGMSLDSLEDADTICSCNNVNYGKIRDAIVNDGVRTLDEIKVKTKAGTGCGGCLPMVKSILNNELNKLGIEIDNSLCEHFRYTRHDLLDIVKVKKIHSFNDLLASHGTGDGCEICKTQIAALISQIWNDYVLDQDQIQETNDKYLGNIQRNGTYSVIPRSAGGELTPDQLIKMGEVAKEYNLYTKLTGSQRVALFGAHLDDLPAIWKKLATVGLESGHAYAKGLRMVKSCVGSEWCRFGVGPSTGFAIELENRYKGMRTPHKVKMGVSGCTRECAEAISKDIGIIATEHGWNLYVGGNGGTYPRHAELLAADIDKETATRYIDRFLAYYIRTGDRLQRTATWILNLDGGIEKLKAVIVEDSLGICADLESEMKSIIDSQFDEWSVTANNESIQKKFHHFVNSDEKDPVKMTEVRGQPQPVLWEKEYEQLEPEILEGKRDWVKLGTTNLVPADGGATFKYGNHQIAVFNFAHRNEWYACQNLCPHKREMVLSRGIIGDTKGIPKVVCPMHKKAFSLKDGNGLAGNIYSIQTFAVEIRGEELWVELPTESDLDRLHICDPKKSCTCFE